MKKIDALAGRPESYILLFFFCLVLFDWPLLAAILNQGAEALFCYLFLTWAVVILVLFVLRRGVPDEGAGAKNVDTGDRADV